MNYSIMLTIAASQNPPSDIIGRIHQFGGTLTQWDWSLGLSRSLSRESTVQFTIKADSLVETINTVQALLSTAGERIIGYSVC